MLKLNELKLIAGEKNFDLETLIKDYYLTLLLYKISKIKGLYFKGGTAFYKIYFNHLRLSEDLDFTVKGDLKEIEKQIADAVKDDFGKVTHDKYNDNFVRLLVHYKDENSIIIDLNTKASLLLEPEEKEIKHFYSDIPAFGVQTLNLKELVAEKLAATLERNAPRDYYDVYNIIKAKMPVDINLVKRKLQKGTKEFDIERIFRPGKHVFSRWETDLLPLTSTKPSFNEVMKTLTEYFKYKEMKKAKKEKNQK